MATVRSFFFLPKQIMQCELLIILPRRLTLGTRNFSTKKIAFGFELSEDQRNLQELARKFSRDFLIPNAQYHDRTGEFPFDICKKAFELGMMNLTVPEKYGGAGLKCFESGLVGEELANGCTGIHAAIINPALSVGVIFM